MKRLLVPMLGDNLDDAALSAAAAVARKGGGHIDARLFRRNPIDAIPHMGEAASTAAVNGFLEAAQEVARECLETARTTFETWSTREQITVGEGIADTVTSANFREIVGPLHDTLIGPVRLADMCILAPTPSDERVDREMIMHAALFESGRPVLVAPAVAPQGIGRRIVVAWNGSQEAARAVAVAMPLLQAAEAVFVVTARVDDDAPSPTDLVRTLEINGIQASGSTVTATDDVAAVLVAEARKLNADLLVIGAYSHSRLREFVLGGVTRDLIESVELPVLMVH